jgi:hypothetical protein
MPFSYEETHSETLPQKLNITHYKMNLTILKKTPLSIYALLFTLIFFISLLSGFTFFWETNDDISMSMYVHGYGTTRQSSPLLVFSNVAWGYLIQLLPAINGIVSYSWLTILVLFLSMWSITYQLTLLKTNRLFIFYIAILIFTKVFVYPQFTITAGIATINGILSWHTFLKTSKKGFIYIALLSFIIGFLIRSREFYVVFACGLILLDWQNLIKSRTIIRSFLILIFLCLTLDYINKEAYNKKNWRSFNKSSIVRVPIIDYQAGYRIRENPELLKKHNFSENDLLLFENWFFADRKIANPKRLEALLKDLDWNQKNFTSLPVAFKSLKVLLEPELLPLVVIGLLMFFFCENKKRILLAWLFLFCFIFVFGLFGRVGTTRAFFPILVLILSFSLVNFTTKNITINQILISIIAVITASSVSHYYYKNYIDRGATKVVARDVRKLSPSQLYTAWGAHYPYELAYPVLAKVDFEKTPKLYSFGVSTLSPHISTNWPYRWYKHFIHRLLKDPNLPIIANDRAVELLTTYCKDHHKRKLVSTRDPKYVYFKFYWINCTEPLRSSY